MSSTTRLSFAEFLELPEAEGVVYELDEGELLMEASPTARHNLVRQRIAMRITEFVEARNLGMVLEETDFHLSEDTIRNPDVAFLNAAQARAIDQDRSPLEGAPVLAVEVVSPSNRADDMAKKRDQYLRAGCQSVWIVYPSLRMIEIHSKAGLRQVREPEDLRDEKVLPGFSVQLSYIFDGRR